MPPKLLNETNDLFLFPLGRRYIMFRAVMTLSPAHLADPGLFDFAGLARDFPPPSAVANQEKST